MSFDDFDPPIDMRIPAGVLGNTLFRTEGEARRAAIAMRNYLNRIRGTGHTIVHHQARMAGHRSHYHVVNPQGRRISGHFFYGSQPYWTKPRQREAEAGYPHTLSPARAGMMLERPFLQGWRRALGAGAQVYLKHEFPRWLHRIFPGASRPDLVAINHHTRHILVGDATRYPLPQHMRKTIGYARWLAQRLPAQLRGYRVFAQERYWGVDPDIRQMLGLQRGLSQPVEVTVSTRKENAP